MSYSVRQVHCAIVFGISAESFFMVAHVQSGHPVLYNPCTAKVLYPFSTSTVDMVKIKNRKW
jgi:hypothetical protein